MKLHLPLRLLSALLAVIGLASPRAVATTYSPSSDLGTVMYVGDSITHGVNSASWRWAMHKILVDNGIAYDAVGVKTGNYSGGVSAGTTYGGVAFNNVHSAQSSARAWEISGRRVASRFDGSNIQNWLGQSTTKKDGSTYTGSSWSGDAAPDTFFLLIGTNDLLSDTSDNALSASVDTITANLLGTCTDGVWSGTGDMDTIVDSMLTANSEANVIVLTIPCWTSHNNNNAETTHAAAASYNSALESWAAQKDGVTLIDINEGILDVAADTSFFGCSSMFNNPGSDGLHPNAQGDLIMAGNVAKALGYAGRTAGQVRKAASAFETQTSALFSSGTTSGITASGDALTLASGSSLSYTWSAETDLSQGYTFAFTLSSGLGNGSADGWNTTENLSVTIGNGTTGGTLNINEAYIQWGDTVLYSTDMSELTDSLRIAYVYGNAVQNLGTGYYVWLDDMLIGEALRGTASSVMGLSIANGSGVELALSNLGLDSTSAWAPTTTAASYDNPTIEAYIPPAGSGEGTIQWLTDTALYTAYLDPTIIGSNIRNQWDTTEGAEGRTVGGVIREGNAANGMFINGTSSAQKDYTGDVWLTVTGTATAASNKYNALNSKSVLTGDIYLRFDPEYASTSAWGAIFGCLWGTVDGDVYMEFSSSAFVSSGASGSTHPSVAGAYDGDVTGKVTIVVNDGTFQRGIIGGEINDASRSIGGTAIYLNKGSFGGNVYAGGTMGTITGNTEVYITGDGVLTTGVTEISAGGTGGSILGNSTMTLRNITDDDSGFAGYTGTLSGSAGSTVSGTRLLVVDNVNISSLQATLSNFDAVQITGGSAIGLSSLGGASTLSVSNSSLELTNAAGDAGTAYALQEVSNVGGTITVKEGVSLSMAYAGDQQTIGSYVVDGGSLDFGGNTTASSVRITAGTLTNAAGVQGGIAINATGDVAIVNGCTNEVTELTLNGGSISGDALSFSEAASVVSGSISSSLSGTGDLIKTGEGTVTLSGANTYTGSTVVEAGTLEMNGTMLLAQAQVEEGATFIINGGLELVSASPLARTSSSAIRNEGTVVIGEGAYISNLIELMENTTADENGSATLTINLVTNSGVGTVSTVDAEGNAAGTLAECLLDGLGEATTDENTGTIVLTLNYDDLSYAGGDDLTWTQVADADVTDETPKPFNKGTQYFSEGDAVTFTGVTTATLGSNVTASLITVGDGELTYGEADTTLTLGQESDTSHSLSTLALQVKQDAALYLNTDMSVTNDARVSGTLTLASGKTLTASSLTIAEGGTATINGTLEATEVNVQGTLHANVTSIDNVTLFGGSKLALSGGRTYSSALSLAGDLVDSEGAKVYSQILHSTGGATLSAAVTGTGNLRLSDDDSSGGTLTVTGALDFTGDLLVKTSDGVTAGTVYLNNTITNDGDVILDSGAVQLNASARVQNTGDLIITNGVSAVANGSALISNSGSITITGEGSKLTLNGGSVVGSNQTIIVTDGGALRAPGGASATLNNLILQDGGHLQGYNKPLNGTVTVKGVGNTVSSVNSGGTTINSAFVGEDAAQLELSGSYTLVLKGVISGMEGGVVKSGSGQVELRGSNTYTGGTILKEGTLLVGTATGFGTGEVKVEGGTLNLNAIAGVTNDIRVTGDATLAFARRYSGNLILEGGTLTVTGSQAGDYSLSLDSLTASGGSITCANALTFVTNLITVTEGNSLSLDTVNATNFTKLGTGKLTIGTLNAGGTLYMGEREDVEITSALTLAADSTLVYDAKAEALFSTVSSAAGAITLDLSSYMGSEVTDINLGLSSDIAESLISILNDDGSVLTEVDGYWHVTTLSLLPGEWDAAWDAELAGMPRELTAYTTLPSAGNHILSMGDTEGYLYDDPVAGKDTAILISSTGNVNGTLVVLGGQQATAENSGTTVEHDSWIKVTGGTPTVLVGGNYCADGTLNFTGNSHIYVDMASGQTEAANVSYIAGGNHMNGAGSPVFTGDSWISVCTNSVQGAVIGGSTTSASGNSTTFIGDTHIFIYAPQSVTGAAGGPLGGIGMSHIIGGNASVKATEAAGGTMTLEGDTNILLNLKGAEGGSTMGKTIIGGSYAHGSWTSSQTGSTNVQIVRAENITFEGDVIAGSLGSAGSSIGGSLNLSIEPAACNGRVIGGSYDASAADATTAATFSSGAHNLSLCGGYYNADVIGGNYDAEAGAVANNYSIGDISLEVAAVAGLNGTLYGGSYSQDDGSATRTQGNIALSIVGNSIVQGDVYAAGYQGGSATMTTESTSVTVGEVWLGSADKTITVSGGYKFAEGVSGSTVTGDRALIFEASGTYEHATFADFDTVTVKGENGDETNVKAAMAIAEGITLTKDGAGTLTLLANAEGGIELKEGTLALNGHALTSLKVLDGTTLDATVGGNAGALTLDGGSTLKLGSTGLVASTVALNLTENDKLTLTLPETASIVDSTGVHTYTLFSGLASTSAITGADVIGQAASSYVTAAVDLTGYSFRFQGDSLVLSNATGITWGADGWGDDAADNWSRNEDNLDVIFNGGGQSEVVISGAVTPGSVVVSNASGEYVFKGDSEDDVITGNTSLTKSGEGTLTIELSNSYTGATVLEAGTLKVNADNALGTGALYVNGGVLQVSNKLGNSSATISGGEVYVWYVYGANGTLGSGTLTVSGGTVAVNNVLTNSLVAISGGTVTVANNGTLGSGALTVSDSGTLNVNNALTNSSVTISGGTVNANATNAFGTTAVALNGGALVQAAELGSRITFGGGSLVYDLDTTVQGSTLALADSFDGAVKVTLGGTAKPDADVIWDFSADDSEAVLAADLSVDGAGTLTLSGVDRAGSGKSLALEYGSKLIFSDAVEVAYDLAAAEGEATAGTVQLTVADGATTTLSGNNSSYDGTLMLTGSKSAEQFGQVTDVVLGSSTAAGGADTVLELDHVTVQTAGSIAAGTVQVVGENYLTGEGTCTISGKLTGDSDSTLGLNDGLGVNFTGAVSAFGGTLSAAEAAGFTITSAEAQTLNATVSGVADLTQAGTGALTLARENTSTGMLTINSDSEATIASGAAWVGAITNNGSLTLQAGASIAGSSGGTLTVEGGTTTSTGDISATSFTNNGTLSMAGKTLTLTGGTTTGGDITAAAVVLGAGSYTFGTLTTDELTLNAISTYMLTVTSVEVSQMTEGNNKALAVNVAEDVLSATTSLDGWVENTLTLGALDTATIVPSINGEQFVSIGAYSYWLTCKDGHFVLNRSDAFADDELCIWYAESGETWADGTAWMDDHAPNGEVAEGKSVECARFSGYGTSLVTLGDNTKVDAVHVDVGSGEGRTQTSYTFAGIYTLTTDELTISRGGLTIGEANDDTNTEVTSVTVTGNTLVEGGSLTVVDSLSTASLKVLNDGTFTNSGKTTVSGALTAETVTNTGGTLSMGDGSDVGTITGGEITLTGSATVDTVAAATKLTVSGGTAGLGSVEVGTLDVTGGTASITTLKGTSTAVTVAEGAQLGLLQDIASLGSLSNSGSLTAQTLVLTSTTAAGGTVTADTLQLSGVNNSFTGLTLNALTLDTSFLSSDDAALSLGAGGLACAKEGATVSIDLAGNELATTLTNLIGTWNGAVEGSYSLISGLAAGTNASLFTLGSELSAAVSEANLQAGFTMAEDGTTLMLTLSQFVGGEWNTGDEDGGIKVPTSGSGVYGSPVYENLTQVNVTGDTVIDLTESDLNTSANPGVGLVLTNVSSDGESVLTIKGNGYSEDLVTLVTNAETASETGDAADITVISATLQAGRPNQWEELELGQVELQSAALNVGWRTELSLESLEGDADSLLKGAVILTGEGGAQSNYQGSYENASVQVTGGTHDLVAGSGLELYAQNGTTTLDCGEGATMVSLNTTGGDIVLNNANDDGTVNTLALGQSSVMSGGSLRFAVDVDEVAAGSGSTITEKVALQLKGVDVTVTQAGDPAANPAINLAGGTTGRVIATFGGETPADGGIMPLELDDELVADETAAEAELGTANSVTLEGAFFARNFTNARTEGNQVLADLNTTYYTDALAQSDNGTEGMQMLDMAHYEIDPQSNTEAYKDLSGVLDALDQHKATGNADAADRLASAVAGASTTALGMAFADDVERQLKAIRNRTTTMGGLHGQEAPAFNAWINAEGDYRDMDADGTKTGYTINSWGGTVGFDVAFSECLTAGLAFTAMYGDLDADAADIADGDLDTYYISAFTRKCCGNWVYTCVGSVGLLDATFDRTVNYGGGSYRTSGETDGVGLGLMYEVAYKMALNEDKSATLQPLVNVTWRHVEVDGYTESGSDAALRLGDQELDTVTFGVGARLQAVVGERTLNHAMLFEARALAKFDAGDRESTVDSVLVNASSTHANLRSAKLDVFGVELGAGLTIPLSEDAGSLFTDCSVELRGDYSNVNATFGYKLSF